MRPVQCRVRWLLSIPLIAFGGAAAMALAMGVARFSYTPILPFMVRDAGLSTEDSGYLATLNFIGYLLASLWPIFARRMGYTPGPKTTLRWSMLAALLLTAGMALTTSFAWWAVLRFASGMISLLIMVYATAIVMDAAARAHAPMAAGVHYSGVGLGIALSGVMVGQLEALQVGWRGLWLGAAGLILLLMPLVFATVTQRSPAGAAVAPPSAASAASARPHHPAWLIAAYALAGIGFIVSGTFLPLIAKQQPHLADYAAFTWVLLGIASIPSNVFWAWVAARIGSTGALVVQYALQAVGVVLPVWFAAPWALMLSGIIVGGTFMGIVTVATAAARNLAPHRTAEIIAIMTAAYSVGQIVGPPLASELAARSGNFNQGLMIAGAALVLGIVFLLLDARRAATAQQQQSAKFP